MTPLSAGDAAEFLAALRPFRRRLLQHTLLVRAVTTLLPFAVFAALIAGVARIWPLPGESWLIGAVLPAWLTFQAILAALRPQSLHADARRIDRLLDLRERVATALATLDQPSGDTLELRQRADALHALRHRQATELHLPVRWRRCLPSVPFLLLTVAGLMLPNPMHERLRAAAEFAERRDAAATRLEASQTALTGAPADADPSLTELRRSLAELSAQLRDPTTGPSEALAGLNRAEQAIRRTIPPDAERRRLLLAQLSRQLADLAQQPPDAPEIQRPAAERLRQIAERIDQLDPAQQRAAAQRFAQQAADTASVDPSLSEGLADAAAALADADPAQAARALQRAADAAATTANQLRAQDDAAAALSAVQQARETLSAQPGDTATAGLASARDVQQAPRADVLPGTSDVAGNAPPPAAAAAPTAPAGSNSTAAGTSGSGDDLIYSPAPLADSGVTAAGSAGASVPGSTRSAASDNAAQVPFSAVLPAYEARAQEAIERGTIPYQLRDLIRDYFSQLAQPDEGRP